MDHDLHAAVEDYRRRIHDQLEEKQRLQELARDLEADRAASRQSARSLRRARADLARAEAALTALKRDYARFRLRQAVGQDPAHIETGVFDEELLAMSASAQTRREARGPRDGRIAFDTFRTLLLADLPLGQLVGNERAERRADAVADMLQERSGTRNILRQWGAMVQSDPYVSDVLQRAAAAAARFTDCLRQFTRALDSLRINYELKQRKVDHLAFRVAGTRPTIETAIYWENVERVCSEEVRGLVEQFLGLETAREELRALREELNEELSAFMRSFIPRYITYVTRQTRARRRGLGLRRASPSRLCQYLLEQVERTDFLLPRGSGMEIAVPRVPGNIKAFRKTDAFKRLKRASEHAAMADASTIEDPS